MKPEHEKIEGLDHKVVFSAMALIGGTFALFFLGFGVLALMKLHDPSSSSLEVMSNAPDELRLAVVLGFGAGGLIGICAVCAALGIVVGPAKQRPFDPARGVIDPTLLLGREVTFRRPRPYLAPEDARPLAVPCVVTLAVLTVGGTLSWWVWRLPLFVYLVAGAVVVLSAQWAVYLVRVELAARRLRLRFLRAPREVRPGHAVEVDVELSPQGPLAIDAVQVLLAGLVHRQVRAGKSREEHVDVLHREVRRLALDGASSEKVRRFRCALQVPADALPTGAVAGSPTPGGSRRTVRWIVAVLVDLPGWPDAARVCEVKVAG